jgi:hypothetical protein
MSLDDQTRVVDEIAARLRLNARKNFIGRDGAKKNRAVNKACEAMHAAKRDRAERREAAARAEAIVRRSPPTRLTDAQRREEAKAMREWDRPVDGVRGGPILAGYIR